MKLVLNKAFLLLNLLILVPITSSYGQSKKIYQVPIELFVANSNLGEVTISLKNNKFLSLNRDELTIKLSTLLEKSYLTKLKSYPKEDLFAVDLEKLSISHSYDSKKLRFYLDLGKEAQKSLISDFSYNQIPKNIGNVEKNSKYSGFLNYSFSQNYYHNTDTQDSLSAELGPVLNLNENIIKNKFRYTQDENKKIIRNSSQIIRDFAEDKQRLILGDLEYNTIGDQQFVESLGLSFSKNYELSPYQNINSVGGYDFYLEKNSQVKIFINDNLIKMMNLPRGRHSLKNLPLNQGINDIRLELTDQYGNKDVLSFSKTRSFELLNKGVSEYNFSMGLPSYEQNDTKKYKSANQDYLVSANFEKGATDNLTLRAYTQKSKNNFIFGNEFLYGTSVGLFLIAPSISNRDKTSWANSLKYQYQDFKGPDKSFRNFTMNLTYENKNYARITNTSSTNRVFKGALSYQQKMWRNYFGNLGASYSSTESVSSSWGVDLSVSKSILRNLSSNIRLSHDHTNRGKSSQEVLLTFNWIFPDADQTVYSSYRSSTQSKYVSWQYLGDQKHQKVNSQVDYSGEQTQDQISLFNSYSTQWFDIGHSHDQIVSSHGNSESSTGNLSFESSISFAGGNFGVSRPIDDSFAIFKLNKHLKGEQVKINRDKEDYEASTSPLGSATISNIKSYRYRKFRLDSSELSEGLKLKTEERTIFSKYHSGTIVHLGDEARYSISGKMIDPKGKGLRYVSGKIVPLDQSKKTITFFTNSSARFFIEGLSEGTYEVKFFKEKRIKANIHIKSNRPNGIIDLGVVKTVEVKK